MTFDNNNNYKTFITIGLKKKHFFLFEKETRIKIIVS